MIKHEIRVDISNTEVLESVIKKAYFEEGLLGKILAKKYYIPIEESDDINYSIFKGLNNATVRVTNDIIDGTMRFIVDETEGDIRLYPISMYCIVENEKYIFY